MVWLVGRRWWLLAGAFVLVLLGSVLFPAILSGIPVGVALFLLFISIPMALILRYRAPRPPSSS
jgi:hypothetical protein